MKHYNYILLLALALVGCEKNAQEAENTLLIGSERSNFSVIGKLYIRYETEDPDVPFYNVRYFVNSDSIKRYHTERADGQVGKYDNIEYETYYFCYPYVISASLRDTLYTFTQDSTCFKNSIGYLFHLKD